MAQATLNVTELDFDQIKANLKSYFKRQSSPFTDWDFNGSGLNMLLDVLAYNTQYNAMLAHMTLNESFIDTAQLRSSVTSQAKLLGYLPRSVKGAEALLAATFTANPASAATTYTLPRGTQFTSTLNSVAYTFVTPAATNVSKSYDGTYKFTYGVISPSYATSPVGPTKLYDATQNWVVGTWNPVGDTSYVAYIFDGTGSGNSIDILSSTANTLTFASTQTFIPDSTTHYTIAVKGSPNAMIRVVEGTLRAVSYVVDNSVVNQKFIIADPNVDISTLLVRVYDYENSSKYTTFVPFSSFSTTAANSAVYFISQNVYGQYEISFGQPAANGAPNFGVTLKNLNVVSLEFVATSGVPANGASLFTFASGTDGSVTGTPVISTVLTSASGGDAESIESVRFNAPQSLITQNRAVTANDYKAILLNNFAYISSLSVWGGEDEVQYDPRNASVYAGQVYISIKQLGTTSNLSAVQKAAISQVLAEKRVMTIRTNFVDPDYTYIYADVFFKYSSNLTTQPRSDLQDGVKALVKNYSLNNLERFDGIFRYSNLLDQIDTSNPAIINSEANIYFYKKFTANPLASTTLAALKGGKLLSVQFPGGLNGTVDQAIPLIQSDSWAYTPNVSASAQGISGSSTITLTGVNPGIATGMIISGTGIPAKTATYVSGSGTQLTVDTASGITVSALVTGANIPANTFVATAITSGANTNITLSKSAGTMSGTITFNSTAVTSLSDGAYPTLASGVILGSTLVSPETTYPCVIGSIASGTGIVPSARVTAITPLYFSGSSKSYTSNGLRLATVSIADGLAGSGITAVTGSSGSSTIVVSSATGIAVGQSVANCPTAVGTGSLGGGIGAGALVTAISGTTITLSVPNSTTVTGSAQFVKTAAGASISGTGVPDNTLVTSIGPAYAYISSASSHASSYVITVPNNTTNLTGTISPGMVISTSSGGSGGFAGANIGWSVVSVALDTASANLIITFASPITGTGGGSGAVTFTGVTLGLSGPITSTFSTTLTATGMMISVSSPHLGAVSSASFSNAHVAELSAPTSGTVATSLLFSGPELGYHLKDGVDSGSTTNRKLYMSTDKAGVPTPGTDILVGTLYPATGKCDLYRSETGVAYSSSGGGTTSVTITDTSKSWNAVAGSYPTGYSVLITSGTGFGITGLIASATANSFTFTPSATFTPDTSTAYEIFISGVNTATVAPDIRIYSEPASNDIAPKRNGLLQIDTALSTVTGEVDLVAISGAAGIDGYTTFPQNVALRST